MRDRGRLIGVATIIVSIAAAAGIIIAAVGWQIAPLRDQIGSMDQRLGRVETTQQDHGERLSHVEALVEMICRRLQCGVPVVEGQDQ